MLSRSSAQFGGLCEDHAEEEEEQNPFPQCQESAVTTIDSTACSSALELDLCLQNTKAAPEFQSKYHLMTVQSPSPPIPTYTLRMNTTEIQNLVLIRIRLKKNPEDRDKSLFIKTQIIFQLYLLNNIMPKHPLKNYWLKIL